MEKVNRNRLIDTRPFQPKNTWRSKIGREDQFALNWMSRKDFRTKATLELISENKLLFSSRETGRIRWTSPVSSGPWFLAPTPVKGGVPGTVALGACPFQALSGSWGASPVANLPSPSSLPSGLRICHTSSIESQLSAQAAYFGDGMPKQSVKTCFFQQHLGEVANSSEKLSIQRYVVGFLSNIFASE